MTEKLCPKCGQFKVLDAFSVERRRHDGRALACRSCRSASREAERERAQTPTVRARAREIQAAHRRRHGAAERERIRAWLAAHPGKQTEYSRRYRYSSPASRARTGERKGVYRDADSAGFVEAIVRDPCCYCGKAGGTVDHIVPLIGGGENHWTNYTGACLSCNGGKRDRTLLTYLLLKKG